ncbi:CobBQ-type GATase domain protein [Acididesulfobacillus acetoxydans]|uniref:Lipid II isoglutaminyl synthase (glutamine-hydrolyzing) subunit GatD n=1 Tax=Acididesulfobacillus acetoxydans TaxID=1561005 RepID=A0A8S0WMP7_9FIRM|nr:glutamine amidotransferase [Acididesulfobacillus acetoxydans]CAA7600694.1 CobBQ-type GATase domain protein [Acididesulfobacillus acetoxydans]CEJ09475.1 CobB/CobQ domain protein glutamine amidotransferase [Acididesulfobacillus acetoxydans]
MKITICHLYPDLLDLYGDRGNILALAARCSWRGIEGLVQRSSLGDPLDFRHIDILFIGGGSDREQSILVNDLKRRETELREAIEEGLVVLGICGGYQLLGQYYQTGGGDKIPGLGILNLWTVAGRERLIGNVIADLNPAAWGQEPTGEAAVRGTGNSEGRGGGLQTGPGTGCSLGSVAGTDNGAAAKAETGSGAASGSGILTTLVGFENHSGRTYLGEGLLPLGLIRHGYGNNGQDQGEGVRYRNVFGTYLHGPLLPKNPHLADLLLALALRRRGVAVLPAVLDDRLEIRAHQAVVRRFLS